MYETLLAAVGGVSTGPVIVVALIGALFSGGGIVAIIKARPEAGKVIVDAAQGAVIVQGGVIQTLHEQNKAYEERIDMLERDIRGLQSLETDISKALARLQAVTEERDRLAEENRKQAERIGRLEERNRALDQRVKHLEEAIPPAFET